MDKTLEEKLAEPIGSAIYRVYGEIAFNLELSDNICRIDVYDRPSRKLPESEEERKRPIKRLMRYPMTIKNIYLILSGIAVL